MDDWLNEAVRRGAQGPLGADPVAAGEAVAVAHAVVAAERTGRKRMSRRGAFLGGAALSLGILGLGVTAAAAAPTVIEWLGWTPDIVAQRTFDFGRDDIGFCEVYVRAEPDYTRDVTDEEADRRTEEARRFLTEHDWRSVLDSITESDIQAEYTRSVIRHNEFIAGGGEWTAPTMSGAATAVIIDRISDEFVAGGYLRDGVSLGAGAGPCSDATESPAR